MRPVTHIANARFTQFSFQAGVIVSVYTLVYLQCVFTPMLSTNESAGMGVMLCAVITGMLPMISPKLDKLFLLEKTSSDYNHIFSTSFFMWVVLYSPMMEKVTITNVLHILEHIKLSYINSDSAFFLF